MQICQAKLITKIDNNKSNNNTTVKTTSKLRFARHQTEPIEKNEQFKELAICNT